MTMRLAAHPRLVLPGRTDRLTAASPFPHLQRAKDQIETDADAYCSGTQFAFPQTRHNAHLIRARIMQKRVVTLLARWTQTGQPVYRRAVLAHANRMNRWTHWSWILWRAGDRRTDGIFDLSYGENSATLAFIWDCLRTTLTGVERETLLATVRRWSWAGFLARQKTGENGWFGRPDSNWNAVCAGGLGLLALTMMEDAPEARDILNQVEQSIRPFMQHLHALDGGWPEGIGYWGYGMRYAFLYLLSWERATGREHAAMRLAGVRRTLDFPLDFSPHGVPCSFGDVNRYWIHPVHYALAERFGREDVIRRLDALCEQTATVEHHRDTWPRNVELLAFHPRRRARPPATQRRAVRRYRNLDWYRMSDRWPEPRLYVSIRGGTTEVPHGHLDLTSFHCVVRDEAILTSLGAIEYLDTTFGPRRWELYEMGSASKNMLMINGVGIVRPSSVKSHSLTINGYPAVWLDASDAMGWMRDNRTAAFYRRCLILLDDRGLLILDRVRLKHHGRIETRFHTGGKVMTDGNRARIVGERRRAVLTLSANTECVLRTGTDPTTTPGPVSTMIRWGTKELHREVTLAALLTPGSRTGRVELHNQAGRLTVRATAGGKTHRFVFDNRLRPAR